jgi:hypothetical protein
MAPRSNPTYFYQEGDVRKKRPFEKKICPSCQEEKLIPARSTFCSKSCSITNNHEQNVYTHPGGSDSPSWKGADVSYQHLHRRVQQTRGKASLCENRDLAKCTSDSFDWSHVHGTNPSDPANYVSLCRSCHRSYDVSRGSANPLAKLTQDQVQAIRSLYVPRKYSQARLAAEFGVSQSIISMIVTGRRYAPPAQ